MRNISVEALKMLLKDYQDAVVQWNRVRQSLIEYEIVDEEDLLLHPFPPNIEAKIWTRIGAKQKQLDEYNRKREEGR